MTGYVIKNNDKRVINFDDIAYFSPPYLCSINQQTKNRKNMEDIEKRQADIRQRAEYLIQRNDKIIAILDNWIPSEEANAKMEREIIVRLRREREAAALANPPAQPPPKLTCWQKFFSRFDRLLGSNGDIHYCTSQSEKHTF